MELKNRSVVFLGDSITAGAGVKDIPANRYDNVLKKIAELGETYNYGISGTRIAPQIIVGEPTPVDLGDFCKRAKEMNKNSDIIIVFGGTNDYGHGNAPFGEESDRTPDTYCGSVHSLMKYLRDEYPDAAIVFMTPMHRLNDARPASDARKAINPGKPLADYVEVICNAAPLYNINVLDLFRTLPLDPNDEAIKQLYVPDGLHPNDLGQHIIAELLFNYLRAL